MPRAQRSLPADDPRPLVRVQRPRRWRSRLTSRRTRASSWCSGIVEAALELDESVEIEPVGRARSVSAHEACRPRAIEVESPGTDEDVDAVGRNADREDLGRLVGGQERRDAELTRLQSYAHRWSVEVAFENAKSLRGAGVSETHAVRESPRTPPARPREDGQTRAQGAESAAIAASRVAWKLQ